MANIYLGLNRGADSMPDKVVEGAASGSTDVELRIDTGKNLTRGEVERITMRLLEALLDGRSSYFPI